MRASTLADFQILPQSFRFLRQHPLQSLGLCLLTMGLFALAPFLQLRVGLPDRPTVSFALTQVCTLPLELYFIPRLLLQLDAEALDSLENPASSWRATFEVRWLRTFGAKLALSIAVAAGAFCCIAPGVLILAIFGWMPLFVLLRGLSAREGLQASSKLMARAWPRVLALGCVLLGIFLLAALVITAPLAKVLPDPTLWQRVSRPIVWFTNLGAGLLNLWLSVAFLALFHRVEKPEESYLA